MVIFGLNFGSQPKRKVINLEIGDTFYRPLDSEASNGGFGAYSRPEYFFRVIDKNKNGYMVDTYLATDYGSLKAGNKQSANFVEQGDIDYRVEKNHYVLCDNSLLDDILENAQENAIKKEAQIGLKQVWAIQYNSPRENPFNDEAVHYQEILEIKQGWVRVNSVKKTLTNTWIWEDRTMTKEDFLRTYDYVGMIDELPKEDLIDNIRIKD